MGSAGEHALRPVMVRVALEVARRYVVLLAVIAALGAIIAIYPSRSPASSGILGHIPVLGLSASRQTPGGTSPTVGASSTPGEGSLQSAFAPLLAAGSFASSSSAFPPGTPVPSVTPTPTPSQPTCPGVSLPVPVNVPVPVSPPAVTPPTLPTGTSVPGGGCVSEQGWGTGAPMDLMAVIKMMLGSHS